MKVVLCHVAGVLVEFVGKNDVHGGNVVLSDHLVVNTVLLSWNRPVEYVELTPFRLVDVCQVHRFGLSIETAIKKQCCVRTTIAIQCTQLD